MVKWDLEGWCTEMVTNSIHNGVVTDPFSQLFLEVWLDAHAIPQTIGNGTEEMLGRETHRD
jgi:hypothetical protein